MTLPIIFGNLPAGKNPASDLDIDFAAVAALGIIPCTATGSGSITLTPGANTPTITAYAAGQIFSFVAPATGNPIIRVNALSFLPVGNNLKITSGALIQAGSYYLLYCTGTTFILLNSLTSLIYYNVTDYGAVGDGTTDNTSAFEAAITACSAAGGGIVYVPPAGNTYCIGSFVDLPNGVCLMGAGTHLFAGLTATPAQWAAVGSWIQPQSTIVPCVILSGHGSAVVGLNFVYNQVIPGAPTYTPTAFPYTIACGVSYATIDNCFIIGAYQGISVTLNNANGGGTGSRISNCLISALRVGLQIQNVNDTMQFEKLWIENQWYDTDATVVAYLNANMVGIECHYCDNSNFNNIQIYQAAIGMSFTNGTCLGITHSLYNAFLSNMDFNDCIISVSTTSTSDTVVAEFSNVLAQAIAGTSTLINLPSDNVDVCFSNLKVSAQATIFNIGNGGSGSGTTGITGALVLVNNARLFYGQAGSGSYQVMGISNEANLYATNVVYLPGASGSATIKTGAGVLHTATYTTS